MPSPRHIATRAWRDADCILQQLAHEFAHMGHGFIRPRHRTDPAVVVTGPRIAEPVPITFGRPRQLTDKAWLRITGGHPDETVSAHSVDGGWRHYQVSMPDVYGYITAAASRKDAVGHLDLVARVMLYSQLTLSEAAGVILDMMRLDPRPGWGHPRHPANMWAMVGMAAIDCWQARQEGFGGRGLGDLVVLAERVREIRAMCGGWHVQQAQIDLEAARARHAGLPATVHGRVEPIEREADR